MSLLVRKISEILTLEGASKKQARHILESDLGLKKNQALWIAGGKIKWIGNDQKIPKEALKTVRKEILANGKTILPGFVECHTHSVFAGSRSAEFEKICQGISYSEISASGGGILSTVKQTRKISALELLKKTQAHVNRFIAQGVTSLEIKSGYALNLKDEIKMLEVAGQLKGPRIIRTFLGAHAKPPEFLSYADYLFELQNKVLPLIQKKKLAERVDIFIEKGFFTQDIAERYLQFAKQLGFSLAIHADQLTLSGGADTAVTLAAMSADHLIQIQDPQIKKLAASEVTCVLLPAADLYLKCAYPPARKLIEAGARVALATDFNPGSSPTQDLALVGMLARLEMKMSLAEVISAYTVGASFALGMQNEIGSLENGKSADFLITKKSWKDLFYSVGDMGIEETFLKGRKLNNAL